MISNTCFIALAHSIDLELARAKLAEDKSTVEALEWLVKRAENIWDNRHNYTEKEK